MNLDEQAIYITNTLTEYLDQRWNIGYSALRTLFDCLSIARENDNPATLDLLTGSMLTIIKDMHNIAHGRLGVNG